MDLLSAVVLAVVQGITEWLPVSSSGHLVLVGELLSVDSSVIFDVVVHLASLLVVLIVTRKEIFNMVRAIIFWKTDDEYFKLACYVLVGTLPAALIGLLFRSTIESAFSSTWLVGIMLLVTGTVLFFSSYAQKLAHKRNNESTLGVRSALIIGLAQSAALFPGISRSGLTISVGLLRGLKAETAASFSFLLFIPVAMGAGILQLGSFSSSEIAMIPLVVGFLVSFIVGYVSLRWLLGLLRKGKLHYFSWYCWLLGLIVLFVHFT